MKRSKQLATSLFVLVCVWVLTGSVQSSHEELDNEESNSVVTNPNVVVKTSISSAKLIHKMLTLAGHVEPYRMVTLRAETSAKVVSTSVARGQRVKANQLIITLSMNDRKAKLKQAETALQQRKSDWRANVKLKNKGLRAKSTVLNHAVLVATAEAELAHIQEDILKTQIYAPFDGVLDQRIVEVGDFVDRADKAAVLVDDSHVLINVQIPQNHLANIQQGQKVTARLVTGEEVSGHVSYIASLANEETRSFTTEIQVPNPERQPWLGLSSRVELPLTQYSAHLVSPALLNLDYQGGLYVKTLGEDNRVETYSVSIIRHEMKGVWVSGLPDVVNLLIQGQGYYQKGEHLNDDVVKSVAVSELKQEQSL
ncbi:efflux RND transporter periplasmic adaptor subunit [Neptunomonas sp.]|uniref:efflux RND transporter periplasmic adaptor subunit n=1 Tax=Neptunomonas sp. TaxID=1971898 RepID=UPI0025E07930|nr:efflux RND transporter periplasmic adaptor subunit [Neptunomonas sp.]